MDPRIGTEFAGHRIESVVGRGGASVVYLAEHLRLARKVALKVLAPHLADDEAFRERFIRESRIAAGLDHPNVITVYDAGEVEGNLYISMRYVEGSDLNKLIESEGALGVPRTLTILTQIASALDAAHANGLVHRDVKPGNMLIEASNVPGFDRAYLSDFGISKRTTSRGGLTRTGQFVGTVDYVAPEQITGEPVDGRTDVYSLGCVLYQCLSGRVPFPGQTDVATIYSHLHDRPPPLEITGGAPGGLDRVFARALAKSREERFDTCEGLIEAARSELVEGLPAESQRRSPATTDEPTLTVGGRSSQGGAHRAGGPGRPGGRRGFRVAALVAGTVVLAVVVVAATLARRGPGAGRDGSSDGSPTAPASPSESISPAPESVRLSWTPALFLERVFGETGRQAILDAVVLDDGVVVAVGSAAPGASTGKVDDAAAWRSANGQRWEVLRSPAFKGEGEQRMVAVVEFDGDLVAAGWDGGDAAVWRSSDQGETWTQSTSPALLGHGPQRIRSLVPVGDQLIAIGSTWGEDPDAAAWLSSDGLHWRAMDVGPPAAGEQDMRAGVSLGASLVVIGLTEELGDTDAAVWVYEAGVWDRVDPTAFSEPGNQVMLDVAGAGEGLPLVVVGCEDPTARCDTSLSANSDGAVWSSDDGREWERVVSETGGLAGVGRQVMRAVVVYQGSFVAVGSKEGSVDRDGSVWASTDGATWRASRVLATGLGGLGNQILRTVVVYERHGLALLGFGVTNEAEFEDAGVWTARRLRG